ncbi:hypothetical protein [Gemmiger formicilis]|uniref:hypothetical protein n=1 Tax=Gemmiger formicilis TaxID=745368 RepID=UPI00117B036A|nr:hypothetical protein [Gemmiger formicilis]
MDVLVLRSVIAVGVFFWRAMVVVIVFWDFFGVSGLPPLGGRVGRVGAVCCFLLVWVDGSCGVGVWVEFLCVPSDGFVVASFALAARGGGALFGFAPHGLPRLRVADFLELCGGLRVVWAGAKALLGEYPYLLCAVRWVFSDVLGRLFEPAGLLSLEPFLAFPSGVAAVCGGLLRGAFPFGNPPAFFPVLLLLIGAFSAPRPFCCWWEGAVLCGALGIVLPIAAIFFAARFPPPGAFASFLSLFFCLLFWCFDRWLSGVVFGFATFLRDFVLLRVRSVAVAAVGGCGGGWGACLPVWSGAVGGISRRVCGEPRAAGVGVRGTV